MNGPTLRGNLILEVFLKAPKCSSYAYNICLMSSSANILWVRKIGSLYGSPVKPYTLKTLKSLYKNQSPILSSGDDYIMTFISSSTLGNSSSNRNLYISDIMEFTNSNILICFGRSEENMVVKNCHSVTFEHNNMFNRYDWYLKNMTFGNSTNWI